jgi:uncharacterized RDD family membrane protein YckC
MDFHFLTSLLLSFIAIAFVFFKFKTKLWAAYTTQLINSESITNASFWHRAYATLLDTIVLSPLIIISEHFLEETNPYVFYWILIFFIYAFYKIFFEYRYGQTLGKKWAGIQVVNQSNTKITFIQSLLRYIPYGIPKVILILTLLDILNPMELHSDVINDLFDWQIIGLISVLFVSLNTKRFAIHDILAKTKVISTQNAKNESYFGFTILACIAIIVMQLPSGLDAAIQGFKDAGLEEDEIEWSEEN